MQKITNEPGFKTNSFLSPISAQNLNTNQSPDKKQSVPGFETHIDAQQREAVMAKDGNISSKYVFRIAQIKKVYG